MPTTKESDLSRSKAATAPGSHINWAGGSTSSGSRPAAIYGSTQSLPAGRPKQKQAKDELKRAESYSAGQLPVYMDAKVLKQVRENTSKFIQQRIANVEKHFGDMCQGLGNYHRRLCKLRDTGDELARFLYTYADKESFNPTTTESLVDFAKYFSAIQDYRDAEVRRLDNKVLGPLTDYGTACKHAKEKLKQAFTARNKELKEQKNLLKARTSDKNTLTQAEVDVQKASIEATRASKQLENEMEVFERKKLEDIKKIFMDFVQIEMVFHARALELYTECYRSLNKISVDDDLEEFRSSLRLPSTQSRFGNAPSGSRTSLNTTGKSFTQSAGKSTASSTPAGVRRPASATPEDTLNTTNRSSMYTDTQDEDEDEDEDDEDEEDEESDEDFEEDTYSSKQHPRRK